MTGTHPPLGCNDATAGASGTGRCCVRGWCARSAAGAGGPRRPFICPCRQALARDAPLAGAAEGDVFLAEPDLRVYSLAVVPRCYLPAAALATRGARRCVPRSCGDVRVLHRDAPGGACLVAGPAAHTIHGCRLPERGADPLTGSAPDSRERVVAERGAHAHAELAQDAVGERRVGDRGDRGAVTLSCSASRMSTGASGARRSRSSRFMARCLRMRAESVTTTRPADTGSRTEVVSWTQSRPGRRTSMRHRRQDAMAGTASWHRAPGRRGRRGGRRRGRSRPPRR